MNAEILVKLSKIDHPIIRALSYFLFGARTQLFYNGNKRISRLMMNGLLLSEGFPMLNIKVKDKLEFYQQMIRCYESGDYLFPAPLVPRKLKNNFVQILSF